MLSTFLTRILDKKLEDYLLSMSEFWSEMLMLSVHVKIHVGIPARKAAKGGFESEDTGKFLRLQHKYSKSLSWAENLNKLFTLMAHGQEI